MIIFKYIVVLFFIFNKIICSPQNHLSTQLVLLILAAGDNNGEIAQDKNGPLEIDISKNNRSNLKKTIIDIIPSLKEIYDKTSGTRKDKIDAANEKFKQLYLKAEQIYISKFGYKTDGNGNNLSTTDNKGNNIITNTIKNQRAHLYSNDARDTNIINNLDLYNQLMNINNNNNNNGDYLINTTDIKNIQFMSNTFKKIIKEASLGTDYNTIERKILSYIQSNYPNDKNIRIKLYNLYNQIAFRISKNNDFKGDLIKNSDFVIIESNHNNNLIYHVITSSERSLHQLLSIDSGFKVTETNLILDSENIYVINNGYNRKIDNKLTGSDEYSIFDNGISLITDCGIKISKKGKEYNPKTNRYETVDIIHKPEAYSIKKDKNTIDPNRINSNALYGRVAKKDLLSENE